VISAIASPGVISFAATDGNRTAQMGESLESAAGVTISASVPAPAGAVVVLIRDGEDVAAGVGSAVFKTAGSPAVYRAEVRLRGTDVPWIVTNPIRVGPMPSGQLEAPGQAQVIRRLEDAAAWRAEKHATSQNNVRVEGGEVAMTFRLGPGPTDGQYAALAYPIDAGTDFASITATLRSSDPMRVSVQVRQPGGADGERWHRSVYVDQTPREVTVSLDDFRLGEAVTDRKPTPTQVRSVLFVVDTWHTKPGTEGTVWISGVSLGSPQPATVKSGR
jgi:hypothetical protein